MEDFTQNADIIISKIDEQIANGNFDIGYVTTSFDEILAPYPTLIWGHATGVIDQKIYVVGGSTTSMDISQGNGITPVSTVYAFDPNTKIWTQKASLNIPRWGHSISVVESKIYVFGGSTTGSTTFTSGNNYMLSSVEAYDPDTNQWSFKTSIPGEVQSAGTAVFDGKIILFGGVRRLGTGSFDGDSEIVQVYDPATNAWSTKSNLPNGVRQAPSAVVGPRQRGSADQYRQS